MIRRSAAKIAILALTLTAAAAMNSQAQQGGYQYFRLFGGGAGVGAPVTPPPANSLISLRYDNQPVVEAGIPLSAPAIVGGAAGPTTFVLQSGRFPAGLVLNSSTGAVSGTPIQYGSFAATIRVSDGVGSASGVFAITVAEPFSIGSPFEVGSADLLSVVVGDNATLTFTGRGGTEPYTLNAFTDAPGLSASTSPGFATITGQFTTPGAYSITATGLDADNRFAVYGPVTIHVSDGFTLSAEMPSGLVGQSYYGTMLAHGGRAPYTYSYGSGAIPDGLNFSNGRISGKPTVAGTYNFSVTATDTDGRVISNPTSIEIGTMPPTSFAIDGVPAAVADLNVAYSTSFTPTGGTAPYDLTLTGSLPPGLTFADGVISGTPTQAGNYVGLKVTGTDAVGLTGATQIFSIYVAAPIEIAADGNLPNATLNQIYSAAWNVIGGRGPYQFTLQSGSVPGLTLDPGGLYFGTPTQLGHYDNLVATVVDADGRTATAAPRSLDVNYAALTVAGDPARTGLVSSPYSATFVASGGQAPYAYSVVGAWPAWLSLDTATGKVTGTPTVAGMVSGLAVRAADGYGRVGQSSQFSIEVAPRGNLTISSPPPVVTSLTAKPFALNFVVSGGRAPYGVTLSGALPAGLSVAGTTISGTPTASGSAEALVATVTDADGFTAATAPFDIRIQDPIAVTADLPQGVLNMPYSGSFSGTGGEGVYTWTLNKPLPAGLSLVQNGASASISGTPTTAQNVEGLIATATDVNGLTGASEPMTLEVTSHLALTVDPAIWTPAMTAATRSVAYAASPTFRATSGVPPYSFSVAGAPSGVTVTSVDGSSAVITGTPTQIGTFTLAVTVTDSVLDTATIGSLPLQVSQPLTLTDETNAGQVGFNYNGRMMADGGRGTRSFEIVSGALPDGLQIDVATGVIYGVPTTEGHYDFTARVTDADQRTAERAATVVIAGTSYAIAGNPSVHADIGKTYTATFTASGGPGASTFAVSSGALPGWLTLNSTTGILSGMPQISDAGDYGPFTVTATDSTGPTSTSSAFSINVAAALTIGGAIPLQGAVDEPVSATFTAAGGHGSYAYSLTGAPPPGVTIASSTGILSGSPTESGSYFFGVQAVDSHGRTANVNAATMNVAQKLAISGTPSLGAVVGLPYSSTFSTSGGYGMRTFSVASGALPGWLTLDPSTGALTGTPQASDVGTVGPLTIRVSDAGAHADAVAFSIEVADVSVAAAFDSPGGVRSGQPVIGTLSSNMTAPVWTSTVTKNVGVSPSMALTATATSFSGTAPSVSDTTTYTATFTATEGALVKQAAPATVKVAGPMALVSGTPDASGGVGQPFATVVPVVRNVLGTLSYALLKDGAPLDISASCAGVTWNAATGIASGTPTGQCSLTGVAVKATDGFDGQSVVTAPFAVAVGSTLAISGNPPTYATRMASYSTTFTATGGGATRTFSVSGNPTWLGINSSTGVLAGTPTTQGLGTYGPVTVTVTDNTGYAVSAAPFSIVLADPVVVSYATPQGAVGETYSILPTVSGGNGSYGNFRVADTSGTLAALGLSFDTADGRISGTASTTGTWTGVVSVDDGAGRTGTKSLTIQINEALAIAPVIGPINAQAAWVAGKTVNSKFSGFTTTGGSGGVQYASSGALPSGVTLQTNGKFAGSPDAGSAGDYGPLTVTATDALGGIASTDEFYVNVVEALAATGEASTTAVVGVPYQAVFTATGESGSYNWLVTNLPPWMTATPSGQGNNTYTLSGTPTVAGTSGTITITLTDAGQYGDSVTVQSFVVTVVDGTATATMTSPSTVRSGDAISGTLATTVIDPNWTFTSTPSATLGQALSGVGGTFSGIAPTVGALTTFTVTAKATNGGISATAPSFQVAVRPALYMSTRYDQVGTIGKFFTSGNVSVSGGVGTIDIRLWKDGTDISTTVGTLCPGLSFNGGATGAIYGTPTGDCLLNGLSFVATDSADDAKVTSNAFVLSMAATPGGGSYTATIVRGDSYTFDLDAIVTSTRKPLTYASGTGWPDGVSLSADGSISATAVTASAGSYAPKATIVDIDNRGVAWSGNITVVNPSVTSTLTSPSIVRTGDVITGTMSSSLSAPSWVIVSTPTSGIQWTGGSGGPLTFAGTAPTVSSATAYTISVRATQGGITTQAPNLSTTVYPIFAITGGPSGAIVGTTGTAITSTAAVSAGNSKIGTVSYAVKQGGVDYDIVGNCGLSFSVSTGVVSGTPNKACAATGLKIVAMDTGSSSNGNIPASAETASPFDISVTVPLLLSGSAPFGLSGQAYSFVPTASGGVGGYAFTVSDASGTLADIGLSLNASTGEISGSNPVAGSWSGTLTVTDAGSKTTSLPVSITITSADSNVFAWGYNFNGQLGDDSTNQHLTPNRIAGGVVFTKVSAGNSFGCGIAAGGVVYCWGNNAKGQLGDGTTTQYLTPTQVPGIVGATDISAGYTHTCAVVSGAAMCWGNNSTGQLGDNSVTQRNTPVQVSGLTSGVTQISAGYAHTCAVVSGAAMCWGDNTQGQLGDNSVTQRRTPVQVSGLTTGVSQISASINQHSCAVLSSGGAMCWGYNNKGQLGDNSVTQRRTPVQVSGLTTGVSQISTGTNHTCAIVSGAAKCWGGGGNYGAIGDGTVNFRSSPAQVTGLDSGVTRISIGSDFSCAVVSGVAKCWGYNALGQLGDGTKTNAPAPVSVVDLESGATGISAGVNHVFAW